MKKIKINLTGLNGILSSKQMKQVIGGNVTSEDPACIKCGGVCHQASGPACCPGGDCVETKPEQGHICN